MDIDFWLSLAAVVLLLAFSAFFSSIESAYFSLSRGALDRLRESQDPRARHAARLMDRPRLLLAMILTGNTIANTAAAALAALIAAQLADLFYSSINLAVIVEVVVMSAVILFFAELIPKFLALRSSEQWAVSSANAVLIMRVVLYPLAKPIAWLTVSMSKLLGLEQQGFQAMSESEIRALVQVGHERGELELDERRMIHQIFEFGDTLVREIMVPRIDIVFLDVNTPLDEILNTVVDKGHSRLPVYEDTIDNVIGLLFAKDLLAVVHNPRAFKIKDLLRDAHFVPEEKKIDDLLRELQTKRIHMTMVVDEYGGIAGLVTMEDIIEEIVGEIQDEYDSEQPMTRRLDEKTLLVDGRFGIDDFNKIEAQEIVPESEAYDTMAGFMFSQLGVVPKKGRAFDYNNFRFIVDEVRGKRIVRIKVVRENGVFEDV